MGNCCGTESDKPKTNTQPKSPPKYEIRQGNFGVKIESRGTNAPLVQGTSYFQLADGVEYTILLYNYNNTNCDVKIQMDGEYAGLYRVDAGKSMSLERPTGAKQKFTFKSAIRQQLQNVPNSVSSLNSAPPQNGALTLTFMPEVWTGHYQPSTVESQEEVKMDIKLKGQVGYRPELDLEKYSAGSTTLGAPSTQTFRTMKAITAYDKARETTITAYLVINNCYQPQGN